MKRFDKVKEILEKAVGGADIGGPHRNFWRNLDLAGFVSAQIVGRRLLVSGDSKHSNLVLALRGLSPFGRDLTPRPPGAIFARMPARRPPVAEDDIKFIERWIDDGCPDEDIVVPAGLAQVSAADTRRLRTAAGDIDTIIRFYRDFDNFFQFQASAQTSEAVGDFMNMSGGVWPGWDPALSEAAWQAAIAKPAVVNHIRYLSTHQLRIMRSFFGNPIAQDRLNRCFWLFGQGTLPDDPLRPRDKKHQMDGATQWLMWLGFADAAIRSGLEVASWETVMRSTAMGLVADALFRTDRPPSDKLVITRYQANQPNLEDTIASDVAALSGSRLLSFAIGLGQEAAGTAAGP